MSVPSIEDFPLAGAKWTTQEFDSTIPLSGAKWPIGAFNQQLPPTWGKLDHLKVCL